MMKAKPRNALGWLWLLTFICAVLTVGCAMVRRQPPDQAPSEQPGKAQTQTVAVFFADWQAQHLIPEPREVPANLTGAALATRLVEEIIAGPGEPRLYRTLPEQVKLLEPVKIEGGVATVNLSQALQQVHGAAGEAMALGSLTLTLTELPEISKVQILVEGKKGAALEHVVLDQPLARPLRIDTVMPDPERATYLLQNMARWPWRRDPARVAQWEGRMFGFTAPELQAARLERPQPGRATATVTRDGKQYVIGLKEYTGGQGAYSLWVIDTISEVKP
jgi:hypothetical protein